MPYSGGVTTSTGSNHSRAYRPTKQTDGARLPRSPLDHPLKQKGLPVGEPQFPESDNDLPASCKSQSAQDAGQFNNCLRLLRDDCPTSEQTDRPASE